MTTTTLHLVRHGEALANGQADPALTSRGLREATSAGQALRTRGADIIVHSSRRRAIESAQAIATSLDGTPVLASNLFEDRTPVPEDWNDVPSRYHGVLGSVPADVADLGARRLADAVQQMSQVESHDRTIVAVTHNFVIGWFVRSVLEAPWWRWIGLNQANGSITTVQWSSDREPHLLGFNECGHLPSG